MHKVKVSLKTGGTSLFGGGSVKIASGTAPIQIDWVDVAVQPLLSVTVKKPL